MDRQENKRQKTRERDKPSSRSISHIDPSFAELARTATSGSASTHSSSGSSTVVPPSGSSPVLSREGEGDPDATMTDTPSPPMPTSPILSERAKGKKRLTSDPHGPSPAPTMLFAIPFSRIDSAAWQNLFSAAPPLIGPHSDHVEMKIVIQAPQAVEEESPGDYVERLEEVLELQEDYASLLKGGRSASDGEEVPEAFWDAIEAGRGNLEAKIAWVRATFGEC